ncbi:MAG: alanine--tRNA ligase [Candidatus Omnitrophica bacterium]|jgi:alanyl-tRNA synthetase|nr:alanine--tRNA ligase [Candidatus Omnitrophota bacterium]
MTADVLRKKFLDFFKTKKHKIVESDSLVPAGDPTVLFTPAGMNQFKKEFLGLVTGFRRAASSQRCLRTDDLDKVGITPVHHTFFEMLGNFSFGDYFKEDAICWAWEFLTEELGINKDKLWVSVYKDDMDAYKIWKDKVGIKSERIIKLGDHDNFWPADAKIKGPNGPCGPCSEIFFDFGKDVGCGEQVCDPTCSCGRFAEIWNLVFTQFNRKEGGALEPLPNKNIDTGMGLERLTAVMQGAKNNFETELFQPIIKEIIRKLSPKGTVPEKELTYAIADHLRAIVFAIYDGVLPSNEARGYVVRKLIRKCSMHLRSLGIKEAFLYKLVPVLAQIMKTPYPELTERQENIAQIILAEEKGFFATLDSSSNLFNEKFKDLKKESNPQKIGLIAFQLYDTYGIPFELTKDWLDKNKLKISLEAFQAELEKQKNRSKSQSAMKGDVFDVKELHLNAKATKFSGYKKYETKAKILKIVRGNTQLKKISKGEEAKIILDTSCFYAESGGQVGDTGKIIKGKNIFKVSDTQKFDQVIVHSGILKDGSLRVGDEVIAWVNSERRLSIARNHTATHLLQAALRKILGKHVKQQGSLVAEDRLRFDFTHFKDVSIEELERIEEEVNVFILDNHSLEAKEMTLSAAKKTNALAFFAEKYSGKVRVVSVGDFSKEFCGGTHLDSTAQIGLFKIIHEGSVASGVRRIEAVTGVAAYKLVRSYEATLDNLKSLLNTTNDKIILEAEKRIGRLKDLEKELNSEKSRAASEQAGDFLNNAQEINGIKLVCGLAVNTDMNFLRGQVDLIKEKSANNTIVALGSDNNGKAMLVVGVSDDLVQKGIDAAALVRQISPGIGGSGGGRKDFAQAGGSKPENLQAAFKSLEDIVRGL